MASADGVEKLEDAIVRSAEQVAGQIRAAKEAISTVIFVGCGKYCQDRPITGCSAFSVTAMAAGQ